MTPTFKDASTMTNMSTGNMRRQIIFLDTFQKEMFFERCEHLADIAFFYSMKTYGK